MANMSEARRRRVAEAKAENSAGAFWRFPPDFKRGVFRMLPHNEGRDDPQARVKLGRHWQGRGARPMVCPYITHGDPCPVCQARYKLIDYRQDLPEKPSRKNPDAETQADYDGMIDALGANVRFIVKGVVRDDMAAGLQLLELPKTVWDALDTALNDENVAIDDAEAGNDFTVVRKGAGLDTRYIVNISDQETPLSSDPKEMKKLAADSASHVLHRSAFKSASRAELESWLRSVVSSDILEKIGFEFAEEGDGEGKSRAPARAAKRPQKSVSVDEDDDEALDDDGIEDDGEDAPPARKPSRRPVAADVAADEEEDEDVDDTPKSAPKPVRQPVAKKPAARNDDEDDDEDVDDDVWDDDEEDDEEDDDGEEDSAPPAKKVIPAPKKPASKPAVVKDDDDDDDLLDDDDDLTDEDEDDDGDEAEIRTPKPAPRPVSRPAPKPIRRAPPARGRSAG